MTVVFGDGLSIYGNIVDGLYYFIFGFTLNIGTYPVVLSDCHGFPIQENLKLQFWKMLGLSPCIFHFWTNLCSSKSGINNGCT